MKPYEPGYFDRDVCRPFYHKGSDCGVLIVHGFTGTCAQVLPLARELADRGYTVRTINLPGHATSEADMAASDWQQWLQAAKQAAYEMRQEVRVFTVCGLSMGGVLSLLIAQQMKADVCVPISAPMAVKARALPFAKLAAPFIPRIAWGMDTERHKHIDKTYDFGYSGFPTKKGADLHRLIKMARRNLFNIQCPVLAVQSDADETIWHGSADEILNGVSGRIKQKLWLHGMPHVVTLTKEYLTIADAMDRLITRVSEDKTPS